MKNAILIIGLGLTIAGCGNSGDENNANEEKSLSSGIYTQTAIEIADGCRMPTPFNGTDKLRIDVHSLSETSLVAHLPGSSLRYEISGVSLESPNVLQVGDFDFTDAGVAACSGLDRAYDCVLHDASDPTLSGTITGDNKVTFQNKIRYVATGTECDAVGQLGRFAGVSFPCETSIRADYEKPAP